MIRHHWPVFLSLSLMTDPRSDPSPNLTWRAVDVVLVSGSRLRTVQKNQIGDGSEVGSVTNPMVGNHIEW